MLTNVIQLFFNIQEIIEFRHVVDRDIGHHLFHVFLINTHTQHIFIFGENFG